MRKCAFSFSAYAHIYKREDGWSASGPAPVCVMRYVSNVRVLCKEQPMLATALPVLDEQKKTGANRFFYNALTHYFKTKL